MTYDGVPQSVRAFIFRRSGGMCEGHYRRKDIGNGQFEAEYLGECFHIGNDTAHINPKRMGGSKLLDSEDNLLYLCRNHHKEFDGENI
jgi:hypothetical protein